LTRFGFIVHPLTARDMARKFPIAKYLPESWVEAMARKKDPVVMSEIKGIRSITGAETEGWFIGLPYTPRQMTQTVPIDEVYTKIAKCGDLAMSLGADILGLGAFTSVVGDGGITIAQRTKIKAVTTGNSYTVATAIEGTVKACELLEVDLANATLAVVGATGSIGKTCARVLGRSFGRTILVGRDMERTQVVANELDGAIASTNVADINQADAIITVSSAGKELILPEHLRPGAVVCDVARPRDVSARVTKERPDVLVIEGGVVKVPGNVEFNMSFGFPAQTAYACMSETMMLALEERVENFTLGKDVTVEQVDEINKLAHKHGFELAGFRSFEKPVDDEAIERAKAARRGAIKKDRPEPPSQTTDFGVVPDAG
jgi:fatty aldehyde-generating acyl-ACP reductase